MTGIFRGEVWKGHFFLNKLYMHNLSGCKKQLGSSSQGVKKDSLEKNLSAYLPRDRLFCQPALTL